MMLWWLMAGALAVNLPFGLLRARTRRFSLPWVLCVHAPIPVIALARVSLGIGWSVVPLLVVASLAGQILGGRLKAASTTT